MGIAIFFLLGLAVAAVIIYPLLPGKRQAPQTAAVSGADIDRALRTLRGSRQAERACPKCGRGYAPSDYFCVRCGGSLPGAQAASSGPQCPSCGAAIHEGDRFCAKCGHVLASGEDSQ